MVQRVASTAYCSPKRFAIVGRRVLALPPLVPERTAVDAHMYVCIRACMRVHSFAYMHACMRTYTHAFANEPPMPPMPTSVRTLALHNVRTHTPLTRTVIRIHTAHSHTHAQLSTYTSLCAFVAANARARRGGTHVHRHTHAHTHTYTLASKHGYGLSRYVDRQWQGTRRMGWERRKKGREKEAG
eukprot:GHVU01054898.1.p2 GENE.GHVU01054898.1~~GHVU01054898.1.p2  ORF type:complete len:185 (-),score=4.21 GHVU01054898.1:32-586(-)